MSAERLQRSMTCVSLVACVLLSGTPARLDAQTRTPSPDPAAAPSSQNTDEWIARAQQIGLLIASTLSGSAIGASAAVNLAQRLDMLPGVIVDRELGDARYVRVRGLDPRWTAVRLDGDRLPSPDTASRIIPLNLIPSTMFERATVERTASADADGDAIGGAVNLVTGVPAAQSRALASVAGGYHAQRSDAGESGGHATFGRRVHEGAVGLLGSVTALEAPLSAGGVDRSYAASSPTSARLVSHSVVSDVVDRRQQGAFGTIDVQRSEASRFAVRGLFGRLNDHLYERWTTSGGTQLPILSSRSLFDTDTVETIGLGGVTGHHVMARDLLLDYRVTGGYGGYSQPDALNTSYERSALNPSEDPSAYRTNYQTLRNERASERTLQASVHVTQTIADRDGLRATLKAGAKLTLLNRSHDVDSALLSLFPAQSLADGIGSGFDPGDFLDGQYELGPHVDPSIARGLAQAANGRLVGDASDVLSDYHARERTGAFFALTDLAIGDRLLLSPGVRYEVTRYDYRANALRRDFEGFQDPEPTRGTQAAGEWLPMVNARYALTSSLLLRGSFTRTLARPDYASLSPYAISYGATPALMGNPDLQPTMSWNSDVMLERTLSGGGSLFGGLFHKAISRPVFMFGGSTIQPRNGEDATLWGVETGYQQRLLFLPSALRPLTLWANYTFASSSAALPSRSGDGTSAIYADAPGRDVTLPAVPRHAAHLVVSYDRARWFARTMVSMRGRSLDGVGSLAYLDVLQDRRTQMDASIGARITRRSTLFADFYNLTSAPFRNYMDRPSLPLQEQDYRWWVSFGLRVTF